MKMVNNNNNNKTTLITNVVLIPFKLEQYIESSCL